MKRHLILALLCAAPLLTGCWKSEEEVEDGKFRAAAKLQRGLPPDCKVHIDKIVLPNEIGPGTTLHVVAVRCPKQDVTSASYSWAEGKHRKHAATIVMED